MGRRHACADPDGCQPEIYDNLDVAVERLHAQWPPAGLSIKNVHMQELGRQCESGRQGWLARTTERQSSMLDMELPPLQPHIAWQLAPSHRTAARQALPGFVSKSNRVHHHSWASASVRADHQAHKSNENGRCSKAQAPDSSTKKDAGMYLSPCGPSSWAASIKGCSSSACPPCRMQPA